MKRIVLSAALVAAVSLAPSARAETLEFTAGQLGGGWYTMATGMSKIIMQDYPELNIKVVPGGGTANPSKVNAGKSQLGMGLDVFTFLAYKGREIYTGKPHENLMMIGMSFSDNYMHFLKAKDAKLGFEELFAKAKNVDLAVTKAGSSDEQTFRWVMKHYGTGYDDLRDNRNFKINQGNYAEMSSQYKDRQVDYVFFNLGIPGAAAIDMLLSREGELMDFPDELLGALNDQYGFLSSKIPAGTYKGQSADVTTIKMGTTLTVNADVSTDTVYKILKSICSNQDKLGAIHNSMKVFDCKTAGKDAPSPLHPGAVKYYKEMGYAM